MDEKGGPRLVHGQAVPLVVCIRIRALLDRQQPGHCGGVRGPGEVGDRHSREFVFDPPGVLRRIPAGGLLSLSLLSRGLEGALAVPVRRVQRGPELVVQLLGVAGQRRGPAADTSRLLQDAEKAVLVGYVLRPSLKLFAMLEVFLLLDLGVRGNHGAAEQVDLRVDPPLLLTLLPLLLDGVALRLLALPLGEPSVRGLGIPIRGVIVDLGPLLRVPVITQQAVLRSLRPLKGRVVLRLLGGQFPSRVDETSVVAVLQPEVVPDFQRATAE
mmetsp:Transcript_68050/g.197091  ORF Transcript_68050/g.197091 Transcript_68050/m.197091 type:complete len:270 (-) Transcript_68050:77-886(-)